MSQTPVIRVEAGMVGVDYITGRFTPDSFILMIGTVQKRTEAFCPFENLDEACLMLTLRSRDWGDAPAPTATLIHIPGHWCVELESSKYLVRVVGHRADAPLGPVAYVVDSPSETDEDEPA